MRVHSTEKCSKILIGTKIVILIFEKLSVLFFFIKFFSFCIRKSACQPYLDHIEQWYDRRIVQYFDGDPLKPEIYMMGVGTVLLFWALGGLYLILDIFQSPRFLYRFKIQSEQSQVTWESVRKLCIQVFINQILTSIFGSVVHWIIRVKLCPAPKHLGPMSHLVFQWAFFMVIREALFYYSHRMLHHPSLYRHFHKQHHEWQTPIALAAEYCHPFEHVISNVIPIMIGPYLMKSHSIMCHIWYIYVVVLTLHDHSGYHFPLTPSPVFHDFHHLKFNVNYGIWGVWDWLHGTDRLFRKSKCFQRHRLYFGIYPLENSKEI